MCISFESYSIHMCSTVPAGARLYAQVSKLASIRKSGICFVYFVVVHNCALAMLRSSSRKLLSCLLLTHRAICTDLYFKLSFLVPVYFKLKTLTYARVSLFPSISRYVGPNSS
jgi:hypothetical protein